MSAVDDARDHLTAVIWEVLRQYAPAPRVHHADMLHAAAERYGHALAEDIAEDKVAAVRLAAVTAEYWGTR